MITTAERLTRSMIEQLPEYKKASGDEYSSACPWCGGEDRFRFWPERGNFWCRQCERKGFVEDAPGSWSKDDRASFMREVAERTAQERQRKQAAIDIMTAQAHTADRYHLQLTPQARQWWDGKGVGTDLVDRFNLGYCPACPTFQASPSYTIPVTYQGKLLNIRHRLALPPKPGDKYRPEMKGLPAMMFNADRLSQVQPNGVVLVEGEIKAIVLEGFGLPTVGIPGCTCFSERWASWYANQKRVYVALDPGAEQHAERIARLIGQPARVCYFPTKPDDFLVDYGTYDQFIEILRQGRKVDNLH